MCAGVSCIKATAVELPRSTSPLASSLRTSPLSALLQFALHVTSTCSSSLSTSRASHDRYVVKFTYICLTDTPPHSVVPSDSAILAETLPRTNPTPSATLPPLLFCTNTLSHMTPRPRLDHTVKFCLFCAQHRLLRSLYRLQPLYDTPDNRLLLLPAAQYVDCRLHPAIRRVNCCRLPATRCIWCSLLPTTRRIWVTVRTPNPRNKFWVPRWSPETV